MDRWKCFVLLAVLSGPRLVLADTISLRADIWCPFNCEPDAAQPGYVVEIAKAALEPAGHKIDYATLSWARAIAEARAGHYTGIVGAAKNDAPDFHFPQRPLGNPKTCFFVKPQAKWRYKDLNSLGSVVIGVSKDYSYGEPFDTYVKTHAKDPRRVDAVSGDHPLELNLKKLRAGRIDAFVEDQSVLKSFFFRQKIPNDVEQAGCLGGSGTEIYVAFGAGNHKAAEYGRLIDQRVDTMRKDGSLKTLLSRYGLEDWERP